MLKYLLGFVSIGLLVACQKPQQPEFRAVKQIEIKSFVGSTVEIEGQLVYFNPNSLSGTLKKLETEVFANDVPISTIDKEYNQEIKAQSEFEIPITAKFELGDLIGQDNIIGGILNAVTQNSVKMQYKGSAVLNIAGVDFSIPFDYEEEVELTR